MKKSTLGPIFRCRCALGLKVGVSATSNIIIHYQHPSSMPTIHLHHSYHSPLENTSIHLSDSKMNTTNVQATTWLLPWFSSHGIDIRCFAAIASVTFLKGRIHTRTPMQGLFLGPRHDTRDLIRRFCKPFFPRWTFKPVPLVWQIGETAQITCELYFRFCFPACTQLILPMFLATPIKLPVARIVDVDGGPLFGQPLPDAAL